MLATSPATEPAARPLPQTETFHVIDGLRTCSRVVGEGPDVVLVHGAGVSMAYWRPAQQALAARGFRVHAFDFPGFGRSEDPPWSPTLARLARHLELWLDTVLPSPCPLVGQSLGTQIALLAALEMPGRIERLVLAAPSGLPAYCSFPRQLLRAVGDVPRETPALFRTVLPAYVRCGPVRFWQLLREQRRDPLFDRLPCVEQPVLVVRGRRDPVVPAAEMEQLVRMLPRATAATIGGAHGAHFTHGEEFASVVAPFLSGDAGTRPR